MAHCILLHEGLWEVMMATGARYCQLYLVPSFPFLPALTRSLPLWQTITGPNGGITLAVLMTITMVGFLAKRVKNEEEMLKDHFQRDWDVYASKRWRFIPFIY
jgi:protein-S-isoprenylcysteine O-methyltransferase Ste14